MRDVALTIDCGTQSLRVMLFDPHGHLMDIEKVEYEPYFSRKPGWAEQDPEVFWESLCRGCLKLKNRKQELFNRIIGVGVSSQRDTMVCVDRDGKTLRSAITWLDQRKAKSFYKPVFPLSLALKVFGMKELIMKAQADGKCNWIMQSEPEIWKSTHKYLQVSGFLNHRLTGAFKDSVASQIGHVPFNYKKMKWASKWSFSRKIFPVEIEKLPELSPPGEILGYITAAAATRTGLTEGLPVVACGSDKGCETIGMGALNEDKASLSFGTTATVQTTTKRYYEPLRFMPPYPAPIPGKYNPEIEIFRGYWMINWFKEEFGLFEVLEAQKKGIAPEIALNELLRQTPPGAMGLISQPFWSPGLSHPSAKGAIIGFGDVHKKSHVYRAVIEGLGFALYDGLMTLQRSGGFKAQQITVSGGASQSKEICQISADIFDLPLFRGRTFETTGLGAAIVTMVGLGIYGSFHEAVGRMVHYDEVFEPIKEHSLLYKEMYNRVYSKMFKALSPLYDQIRDIIGYPERDW